MEPYLQPIPGVLQANGSVDAQRAEASAMTVAVIVFMLVGVALSAVIWRLQGPSVALAAAQYG